MIKAINLESKAKYPRIIIDVSVVKDSMRLQFDSLEKIDFLTLCMVKDKNKYINRIKAFLSQLKKSQMSEFFFDDLYAFRILDSFDDFRLNKDNKWKNVDSYIDKFVYGLNRFFTKNLKSFATFYDMVYFLDYLEKDCKISSCLLHVHLYGQKESFLLQTDLIEKNKNQYDSKQYLRIKEKYSWIKDYHNWMADTYSAYDDFHEDLFIE